MLGSEPDDAGLQVGSFADLAATEAPPLDWVASNLIPSRTVTLLTGDGGSGKSLLAMQLMLAVATGTLWIGTQVMRGRAFGLFCEDDQDTLHRRVRRLVERLGLEPGACRDASYISRAGEDATLYGPSIDDPRTPELSRLFFSFAQKLRAYRPDIAIIDTAADVYGANENIRSQVREFIRSLRDLAMDLKCGILLCAHPSIGGITSGRGFSGSTAWHNSVRSRIFMKEDETDPDIKILSSMKQNYTAKIEDIRLRYEDGAFMPVPADDTGTVANITRGARERAIIDLVDRRALANRWLSSQVRSKAEGNYLPEVAMREIKGLKLTVKIAEAVMRKLIVEGAIEVATVDTKAKRRGLIKAPSPEGSE